MYRSISTPEVSSSDARKEEHTGENYTHPSLFAISVVSLAAVGRADDDTAKEQNEIRNMVQNTLHRLYKADPKTKAAIEGAAGYAIVCNMRVKIFVGGPGKGEGITVNNKSKSETFMKRIELQSRIWFWSEEISVDLCLRQRKGAQQLRQLRLGFERTGYGGCKSRTQGTSGDRRSIGFGRRLDVSTDRQGVGIEVTAGAPRTTRVDDPN